MGKRLVITEKPSVARDIVDAIGGFSEEDEGSFWESDDYLVTFAVGHLLELLAPEDLDPKYKRWTLDTLPILPENFQMKPKSGTRDRIKVIKRLMEREDVGGLVNACDAGREGELIFREVVDYLKSTKPIERLWLQSMTKNAIVQGFKSLHDGQRYEGLSQAAQCRNYSDWLIGMNATRALTRRLKSRSENQAWSAGRVQTPTLAMLVDRELEVLQHVPVPYWRIKAIFSHEDAGYEGLWFDPNFKASESDDGAKDDRIFDEARAQEIVAKIKDQPAKASETRKPSKETAPPLFDLTSLQREANRRFGWSAKRTLGAAQKCYESHKVLTYPRTDTKALPNDYRSVVDEVIVSLGADERFSDASARLQQNGLLNTQRTFDDAKVTDHFAIIPTGVIAELSGDDARIFDLVTRRFLATFHPPAIWSRVERTTEVAQEFFRSRSKVLQVPGWREVLGDAEGDVEKLAPLVPGQDKAEDVAVSSREFNIESEETKPPPRINEARMLSLMENAGRYVEDEEAAEAMKDSGIGTPATRADIIENLIRKGYVVRSARSLRPAVKGIRLIDILRRMQADRIASPQLTGELEKHLSDVEHGRMKAQAFMSEIYEYASDIVELTKGFEFNELFPDDEELGKCPLCTKPVYERSWFYRCKEPEGLEEARKKKDKDFEDCPFRIWKDKSGRYIDKKTVRELLEINRSRPLDGFQTRQGRTYRGVLELTDGEIQLSVVEGSESDEGMPGMPEYTVDERPLGKCPHCNEGDIVETRSTFICTRGLAVLKALEMDDTTLTTLRKKQIPEDMEYCSFLFPRTVCKREITRDEAEVYLKNGKTEILNDFISKRGRPFSAMLFLRDSGRHGFEFPPRGGASGEDASKKKASKKKATKKKATTKKKAAAKKKATTKKKATAKKATAKKATAKKKTTTKKKAATKTKAATKKKAASKKKASAKKTAAKKDSEAKSDASPSDAQGSGTYPSSRSSDVPPSPPNPA